MVEENPDDETTKQQAREQLNEIMIEHSKIAKLRQELAELQEVERQCEQERREISQLEEESAKRQELMLAEMARLKAIRDALLGEPPS